MIYIIACGYETPPDIKERFYQSLDMQSVGEFSVIDRGDVHYPHRYYLMENTVEAVKMTNAKDNDILIFADLDDFFCSDNVIKIITETYDSNPTLLLTYGSYVCLSTSERGKFSGPYEQNESFRTAPWRGSHLKTMKYKLWKAIPEREFKDRKSLWIHVATDRAIMLPAMELAGHDRIKWIEQVLYCYDDTNPNSVWKTNRDLSLRTRDYIHSRAPLMLGEF